MMGEKAAEVKFAFFSVSIIHKLDINVFLMTQENS